MTANKRHIFLTRRAEEVARWREAFPDAEVVSYSRIGTILVSRPGEALVWLHLAGEGSLPPPAAASQERRREDGPAEQIRLAVRVAPGCAVVVLANQPDQEEGLLCLEAGASGYTSVLANPEVLRQIAMVVENGGLWVGPDLLSRLRTSLTTLQSSPAGNLEERLSALSPREREVARDMGITDRTVKAHLTAIFERLGVRDRMQLAILVNTSGS